MFTNEQFNKQKQRNNEAEKLIKEHSKYFKTPVDFDKKQNLYFKPITTTNYNIQLQASNSTSDD